MLRWAGSAGWEASPGAQLVSQPQVQVGLSVFLEGNIAFPAVSVSVPKLLNKARSSK